jgi:hypothetical protein
MGCSGDRPGVGPLRQQRLSRRLQRIGTRMQRRTIQQRKALRLVDRRGEQRLDPGRQQRRPCGGFIGRDRRRRMARSVEQRGELGIRPQRVG